MPEQWKFPSQSSDWMGSRGGGFTGFPLLPCRASPFSGAVASATVNASTIATTAVTNLSLDLGLAVPSAHCLLCPQAGLCVCRVRVCVLVCVHCAARVIRLCLQNINSKITL